MATQTAIARRADPVVQFSVFTQNRLGKLNDLVAALNSRGVHVLALTILDSTDSAIIRFVVDDPDKARELMDKHHFPYTESELLVVAVDSATELNKLMAALLEPELNINYLYSFIPHPDGKSIIGLSMEDHDMAAEVLRKHRFKVLKQQDLSR